MKVHHTEFFKNSPRIKFYRFLFLFKNYSYIGSYNQRNIPIIKIVYMAFIDGNVIQIF